MNDFTRILYTKIQIQYTTTLALHRYTLLVLLPWWYWERDGWSQPATFLDSKNGRITTPPLSIALKLKQEPPKLCKPCWYPMLKVLLLHFINFDFYQREKVSTIIKLNENELVLIILLVQSCAQ